MKDFTLEELTHFYNNESDFLKEADLNGKSEQNQDYLEPKNQTIQNILSYSKVMSVRKSKHLDRLLMNLN